LNKTNKQSEAGFTLLELLIVIVIIGILALLILPNITSAPAKANDTKRKTHLVAIQKALEAYYLDNNTYPATAGIANVVLGVLTTDNEIASVPVDPKNGNPSQYEYIYTPSNGAQSFTLTACLQNSNDSGLDVLPPIAPCTTKTFELVSTN
jgi:general secretion pathway protein G